MILLFWILGMLVSFGLAALIYQKIDIVKMLIVGSSIYFCLYIFVSGLLVWINHFNVLRCTVLTFIGGILLSVLFFFVKGRYIPQIKLDYKRYIPLMVLLIGLGYLSQLQTSGYLNMDQDEGVYQVETMYYIGDHNDNYVDFPEYYELPTDYEKEFFKQQLAGMRGYYPLHEVGDAEKGTVTGALHGVRTFSCVMALWGKMFSLHNLNGMLTFMYLLLVANAFLICMNMKFRVFTGMIASITVGICPMVMWSSKTVLTEIVVAMILSLFFVLITEIGKKEMGYAILIPLSAFCFLHVTATIFMPCVFILFLLEYAYTKKKSFLWSLCGALLIYACGFSMMIKTARQYVSSNFSQIFVIFKWKINCDNIEMFIWIVVIVVEILLITFALTPLSKKLCKAFRSVKKTAKGSKKAGIVLMVIATLVLVRIAMCIAHSVKYGLWISRNTSVSMMLLTGFVMLPCGIACMYLLRNKMVRDKNKFIMAVTLLYVLAIYCCFVWLDVYRFYYYGRYFTPFMMIPVICGCVLLDYFSWRIVAPVMAVCSFFTVKQSWILYTTQDNTYCSYENVESFASCIGAGDLVIVLDQGMSFSAVFALPIDALTDADMQYASFDTLPIIVDRYKDSYDNIYVALYDVGWVNEESGEYRYVYKDKMKTSCYETYIDDGLPYPTTALIFESPIALMMYTGQ